MSFLSDSEFITGSMSDSDRMTSYAKYSQCLTKYMSSFDSISYF